MTELRNLERCRALLEELQHLDQMLDKLPPEAKAERKNLCMLRLSKSRQRVNAVQRAVAILDRVSSQSREVLWSYYVRGKVNKDIAKDLGCSVREVMRRKQRGLEELEVQP